VTRMAKIFCPKCGSVIYGDEVGCIYDEYVRTDAEMQVLNPDPEEESENETLDA
jgi:hypothetical protein